MSTVLVDGMLTGFDHSSVMLRRPISGTLAASYHFGSVLYQTDGLWHVFNFLRSAAMLCGVLAAWCLLESPRHTTFGWAPNVYRQGKLSIYSVIASNSLKQSAMELKLWRSVTSLKSQGWREILSSVLPPAELSQPQSICRSPVEFRRLISDKEVQYTEDVLRPQIYIL